MLSNFCQVQHPHQWFVIAFQRLNWNTKLETKRGTYRLNKVGPTLDVGDGFPFSNDDVNHKSMSVKQPLTLKFWVFERNQGGVLCTSGIFIFHLILMRDLMEFKHHNPFISKNKYIVSRYQQTCDWVFGKERLPTEGRLGNY